MNAQALRDFANSSLTVPADTAPQTVTEGDDRLAILRPVVEMYADDISALFEDLSPEILGDSTIPLTQADVDVLTEQIDNALQEQFLNALSTVPDLTAEEAQSLGEGLEAENFVTDGVSVGAWLFRVASLIAEQDRAANEEADSGDDSFDEENDAELSDGADY